MIAGAATFKAKWDKRKEERTRQGQPVKNGNGGRRGRKQMQFLVSRGGDDSLGLLDGKCKGF